MADQQLPSTDNTSLTCAARVFGYECADENLAFLRCKQKDQDPRACLPQGEKVTACVLKVYVPLKDLETHCGETYNAYKKALKKNYHQIDEVRKEQAAMEQCWREFKGYNKQE
ncbi:hypothetical protein ATCC90586_005689 [Pythium insidiosum]|nr:hypothetical protein ATCC90586_005689 [Pythium insidiosum]